MFKEKDTGAILCIVDRFRWSDQQVLKINRPCLYICFLPERIRCVIPDAPNTFCGSSARRRISF